MDLNVGDQLYSIRNAILSKPQITVFSDPYDKNVATIARNLLNGRIARLCINDSVPSQSAFITQHVHLCPSEEQKTSKVLAFVVSHVLLAFMCWACIEESINVLILNFRDFFITSVLHFKYSLI